MKSALTVSWLNKFIALALGLIKIPILLNYFGNEVYGIWALVIALSGYVTLMDFGIAPALKNKLIHQHTNNDDNGFHQTTIIMGIVSFGLLCIGLFFLLPLFFIDFSFLLNTQEISYANILNQSILIIFSLVLIRLATNSYIIIYDAIGRLVFPRAIEIVFEVFSFIIMLVMIFYLKSSIVEIIAMTFILPVIKNFYLVYVIKQFLPKLNEYIKIKNYLIEIKEILKSSFQFFGIQISAVVISTIPTIYISKFFSLTALTEYSILYKILSLPLVAIVAIMPIFWRDFGVLWAKKDTTKISSNIQKYSLLIIFCVFIFGVIMVYSIDYLVYLWTKKIFDFDSMLVVAILFWVMVESIMYIYSTFLHSISDFKYELKIYTMCAFLMILFGFLSARLENINVMVLAFGIIVAFSQLVPMYYRVKLKIKE